MDEGYSLVFYSIKISFLFLKKKNPQKIIIKIIYREKPKNREKNTYFLIKYFYKINNFKTIFKKKNIINFKKIKKKKIKKKNCYPYMLLHIVRRHKMQFHLHCQHD